jgi:hypothetical protein
MHVGSKMDSTVAAAFITSLKNEVNSCSERDLRVPPVVVEPRTSNLEHDGCDQHKSCNASACHRDEKIAVAHAFSYVDSLSFWSVLTSFFCSRPTTKEDAEPPCALGDAYTFRPPEVNSAETRFRDQATERSSKHQAAWFADEADRDPVIHGSGNELLSSTWTSRAELPKCDALHLLADFLEG